MNQPVPPPSPVGLEVYSWFPCADGLRRGWASCYETIEKIARRASAAGVRLSGWMLDNPFQKWPNPTDDKENPLKFDQYIRCITSLSPLHRAIGTVSNFHVACVRNARAHARYGHGNDNWVYLGPPDPMADWAYNYLFECLAPILSVPTEANVGIAIDGSAGRDEDAMMHLAIQQVHRRRTMVEAIPGPDSPFNDARYAAFALYLAAKADRNTPQTPCPLHVIWRGASEEAPILGVNPDGSLVRGEPVPLEEAIGNIRGWRARLYLNVDMLSDDVLRTVAAAQGTAQPQQPGGNSEAA